MHNVGKSENPPWCQSVMKNKKLEPIILGPSTHIQVLEDCAVKKKKIAYPSYPNKIYNLQNWIQILCIFRLRKGKEALFTTTAE